MFYHHFSAPADIAMSLTRSTAGQRHTELDLNGGTFEFNRVEPNAFKITGNVEFNLDNAGGFGAHLIIEQNGPGLLVNLRLYVGSGEIDFLTSMLQGFGSPGDGSPYIEIWSNVEFQNQETPYTPIEKIELFYSKHV